jgi:hypothetical protein
MDSGFYAAAEVLLSVHPRGARHMFDAIFSPVIISHHQSFAVRSAG